MPKENDKSDEKSTEDIPLYTFSFFPKSTKQEQTLTLHAVILHIVANSLLEIPQAWIEDIRKKVTKNPQVLCIPNKEDLQTPLHLAAEGFAGLMLLKIFREYLEANSELRKKTLYLRDRDGRTILDLLFLNIINNEKIETKSLKATDLDFEELVIYFVKNGVSIDLNAFGIAFLNGAAERGFIKIIEAVVKYQFNDFSAIDKNVFDAMNMHVRENFDCKKIFFQEVCRIIANGETEEKEILAFVKENDGEPMLLTFRNTEGNTLCHWAANNNRWSLFKQFMIQLHKIDKFDALEELWDPVYKFVISHDELKSVVGSKVDEARKKIFIKLHDKLFDKKINNTNIKKFVNSEGEMYIDDVLNIIDGKGRNLLHYAALCARNNIFKMFLTILAKQKDGLSVINAKDCYGKTPLDYLLMKICFIDSNQFFIRDFEESIIEFIKDGARCHFNLPAQFYTQLGELRSIGFSEEVVSLFSHVHYEGLFAEIDKLPSNNPEISKIVLSS